MSLETRIQKLERAGGNGHDGACICGLVGDLIGEGEPAPEPRRCPACGGIMGALRIVETILEAPADD